MPVPAAGPAGALLRRFTGLRARYGTAFRHPHPRSGTAGDRPLSVPDDAQAAAGRPAPRAVAAAGLRNLVFQLGGDVRVIPAGGSGRGGPEPAQHGRRPGRVPQHPPVAEPVKGGRPGAGPPGKGVLPGMTASPGARTAAKPGPRRLPTSTAER